MLDKLYIYKLINIYTTYACVISAIERPLELDAWKEFLGLSGEVKNSV